MATLAERAVIAAARRLVDSDPYNIVTNERTAMDLSAALDALDAAEATAEPAEQEITWGELVAGDEMYSTKAARWFTVSSVSRSGATMNVRLVGVAKPFSQPAATAVKVRRSDMGKALDVFAAVLWSGQGAPE